MQTQQEKIHIIIISYISLTIHIFDPKHCVIWKRALLGNVHCALSVVLEPYPAFAPFTPICSLLYIRDENRFLAMNVVNLLVKVLADMPSPFTRPEEVFTLLHQFLPNGLLMCVSSPFAKHLKQAAF
jgi:hypothetical protein